MSDDRKPPMPEQSDIVERLNTWFHEKFYSPGHRTGELLREAAGEIAALREAVRVLGAEVANKRSMPHYDQIWSSYWSEQDFYAFGAAEQATNLNDLCATAIREAGGGAKA